MGKIAIKGNRKNGAKIIKYLEKLGGDNSLFKCLAEDSGTYYFVDSDGDINYENKLGWFEKRSYILLDKIPSDNKYELWEF